MDGAYLSAIAALSGSVIGGLTSLAASWLSHNVQARTQQLVADKTRALRRCKANVVLIDRRNHHIFQPLLYQVATSVLAPADVAHRLGSSLKSKRTSL